MLFTGGRHALQTFIRDSKLIVSAVARRRDSGIAIEGMKNALVALHR